MIITTSILALPIVVALYILDAWIVLLSARLVLPHVRAAWAGRACTAIAPFTDGLLTPATQWAQRRWPRLTTSHIGLAVLLASVIARHLMIRLMISLG